MVARTASFGVRCDKKKAAKTGTNKLRSSTRTSIGFFGRVTQRCSGRFHRCRPKFGSLAGSYGKCLVARSNTPTATNLRKHQCRGNFIKYFWTEVILSPGHVINKFNPPFRPLRVNLECQVPSVHSMKNKVCTDIANVHVIKRTR